MKKLASVLAAAAISFALGWSMVSHRLTSEYAARLAEQRANWEAERAAREGAGGRAIKNSISPVAALEPAPAAPASGKPSPEEIITRLRAIKPGSIRGSRQTIHGLEELIAAGPEALPAIVAFLGRNEDIDYVVLPEDK